jgi:hypothetical protein
LQSEERRTWKNVQPHRHGRSERRAPPGRQAPGAQPKGCTEAVLMAHGFPTEIPKELVSSGNAKADA